MEGRILVVDDDAPFRDRLVRAFVGKGYVAEGAESGHAALDALGTREFSFMVLDLKMPGIGGLEVIRKALEIRPELTISVLTGYGNIPTAVEAIRLGAQDYLTKPTSVDQILLSLGVIENDDGEEIDESPPSLWEVEAQHIQRVLRDCGGNISLAAKNLGLHRRTLQRKLAKLPEAK